LSGKIATQRWAEARERDLINGGKAAYGAPLEAKVDIPTLAEFTPRFIEKYARANRQKPSTIASKEQILRTHLIPIFGAKRLDQITPEEVQSLKATLAEHAPKTACNVLSVLGTMLRVAKEWGVIGELPCTVKLPKVQNMVIEFYETEELERLTTAATKHDLQTLLVVLLGGDAGLRCGEMIALRWIDVDFARGHLKIEQAVWRGHLGPTKGNKSRIIPMTRALAAALKRARHLRGERVLWRDNARGSTVTRGVLEKRLKSAERLAGLEERGALHKLRHTFGSHLAMKGAPVKAIQELMGHENLATTMRYMHLSPTARRGAIDLLNDRRGADVEQGGVSSADR
jgi:integrase